ncbi:rhodanese-like domain-containing protein [Paenibacillus sp. CCS19]|uniref:rhodanese-like domain-containing protein n=1 Tax=Paenibacillus sp. CCS19 TaxID=3158387 RepID=UPI00256E62E5|nr:rhodanese-like domain-containing protein [Paenibacillus cellulosilyticus]GMK39328.1 rhodanese-like domain-containing protein [Paenibacillus cellulosilyticus]
MAGKFSKEITTDEVAALIKQGNKLHIVDVRELDEWQSGHIPGAKHIPLGTLGQRRSEIDSKQETIVVCRSGNRSGLACEMLESLGYDVVNMTGGMMNWNGNLEF